MRLFILIKILNLVLLITMLLTCYNYAYENGYEHGVIAGYWHFDKPQSIKELENGTYKKRTLPGGR